MPNQLGRRYQCETCGTMTLCTKPGTGAILCCQAEMPVQQPSEWPRFITYYEPECVRCGHAHYQYSQPTQQPNEGLLFITYYEPECVRCGYANYQHSQPTQIGKKSISSGARRFVFRYVGDSPRLVETLLDVCLERLRNRAVFAVTCPFCEDGTGMEQSSLSGKRREIREERYSCPRGHRISLIPIRDGIMGWK